MSKFIGDVSAYAYAVNKGYMGTEEEFAELMASYATVGQTAVDAKDAAVAAKTAAQTAATTATNKASEATTAAQTATTKAGEAQTSAQTASSKASEASQSASTASQKASEASQSASQALSCKTDAEQAKTASQTAQGLAESARDLAQGYAEDAQGYAEDAQASAEGISASASQIAQNTANILKAFPTDTASGSIASFVDGADDIPLKSLVVNIDPVQDLSHGDPSPENLCPISGWEGCEVNATNTNLCGGSKLLANARRFLPDGIVNEEEEYFQFTAGAVTADPYRFSTGVPFKENTRYTFIFTIYKTTGTGSNIRVNYTNGSYGVIPFVSSVGVKETVVYTSLSGRTVSNVTKANNSGNTRLYYNESGIFEGVLTADQFKQFGKYIPINWQTEAGTVYGGKLDVLSGKLTVYPYYASYNGETLTGEWISDRDVYAVGTTPTIGAQVVNVGAQGVTVQLEPHEVESLHGVNNLWADSGDTTAEYRADTKLYISKKIAEAISALS